GEAVLDLRQRASGSEFAMLIPICEGIDTAFAELKLGLRQADARSATTKPLALLGEFAKAVQLSVNVEKNETVFADEIGSTVERIKARRAAIAQERMDSEGPQLRVAEA